jgi:hypothetical protein
MNTFSHQTFEAMKIGQVAYWETDTDALGLGYRVSENLISFVYLDVLGESSSRAKPRSEPNNLI